MTMEIWRGFDVVVKFTVKTLPVGDVTAVPLNLFTSGYTAYYLDIDDKSGAADRLNVEGDLVDDGSEALRGRVDFPIARAATIGWPENVRWRAQVRVRDGDGKWYPCGGPDVLIVRGRVADNAETEEP